MNEDELTQKDIDEYNKRRQEEYDEATKGNEEIRRRREGEGTRDFRDRISGGEYKKKPKPKVQSGGNTGKEFIPDKTEDFAPAPDRDMRTDEQIFDPETDQFGNPKFAQSIGFEVGANIALDKATIGLLGAPIPGARPLYALANVAGSGIINYLAQRIRGTEFSLGELLTASGLSLVPGGTQAQTAKGAIGKASLKGAGLGATQVTSESLIDTGELPDAETFAAGTLFGGAAGGIFQTASEAKDVSYAFRALKDRFAGRGGSFTELETVGAAKRKIPGSDNPDQKNIFTEARDNPSLGQSDEAINEQYQALYKKYDNRTLGNTIDENLTNKQKREKYSRKLNSKDLDLIIQEESLKGNTIPPEKAQEYVDLVNDARLGQKEYITVDGKKRLRRTQKGFIGTISYLNAVAKGVNPENLGSNLDVIKHISKEMGIDAIGLKRIIEGQGGEISFQTEGMKRPKKIRSLTELADAYMLRMNRYKEIPAFEKGHVFAANNIINDMDINNLTDFYNNLEGEISRSIREQLDDVAIEQLIQNKGKVKSEDFYETVVEGNRKRRNKQDPDKILADLLGTQYGLRESFLTFVNPERSLSNIIPVESKAAFAELYRKELLAEIKGIKADLRINKGQSSIGPATIDQLKLDVARSVAQEMKNNKILEEIILMDDIINKRGMTQQGEAKPLPNDPIKREPDGTIKGDTPDQ